MTTESPASVLESLAAKIQGLDLSDAEAGALHAILTRAAASETEVEGFGLLTDDGTIVVLKAPAVDPNRGGFKVQFARGLGLDPARVWTDMRP